MSIEAMKQIPLHELLAKVPADARLVIEDADGLGASIIPVGRYCHEASTALRQAIEQAEQKPVAGEPLPCPFCGDNDGLTMTDGSTYRWGYAYCNNCGASAGETRRAYPDDGKWYQDAIQQWNKRAPPPKRKPLSEGEIATLMDTHPASSMWRLILAVARAIEAKHGIGGGE